MVDKFKTRVACFGRMMPRRAIIIQTQLQAGRVPWLSPSVFMPSFSSQLSLYHQDQLPCTIRLQSSRAESPIRKSITWANSALDEYYL